MLDEEDGKELLSLARKTVEDYFKNGKLSVKDTRFKQKSGIFVSIHTYPNMELRGCIGFVSPKWSLGEAVQRAAISSAFQDPRFPPLTKNELKKVIFEISVLTEPVEIKVKNPKEYLEKIEVGKDGLIIECLGRNGLLLPQVASSYNWSCETFLKHLCLKAGLSPDIWLDEKTKIYKFQAQIFKEEKPD